MSPLRGLLTLTVAVSTAGSAGAQARLGVSNSKWIGEFSLLPEVRVLPGEVIAVDRMEHGLVVISSDSQYFVPISKGEGPEEVVGLRTIAPFRGDSSIIFGRDVLRAVIVDRSGAPLRTISLREFDSDSAFLFSFHGGDSAGHLAFLSPRVRLGTRDSANLVLIDPARSTATLVAALWFPPPPGVYHDQDPSPPDAAHQQRDQVVLLSSGRLVIYRTGSHSLDTRSVLSNESRHFSLPAKDRPKTRAERRQTDAARATARSKLDSVLARVPSELRPRIAAQLQAGLDQSLGDQPVPAYAADGLIALSANAVAIRRGSVASDGDVVYDWVDVATGRSGSFSHKAEYRLLGGGFGKLVLGRMTEDGFVQLAVVQWVD